MTVYARHFISSSPDGVRNDNVSDIPRRFWRAHERFARPRSKHVIFVDKTVRFYCLFFARKIRTLYRRRVLSCPSANCARVSTAPTPAQSPEHWRRSLTRARTYSFYFGVVRLQIRLRARKTTKIGS